MFAKYYLRAFDAWSADSTSTAVPQAWKMAFNAARDGKVSGAGNFFLGLNAHINHDLALAMAAAGLTGPDGVSEKINYDDIDALLNSVTIPLIAELSARLDPSMDDTSLPLHLDAVATGNVMYAWREQAWRNAELLASASTPLAKNLVTAHDRRQLGDPGDDVLDRAELPAAGDHQRRPQRLVRRAQGRPGAAGLPVRLPDRLTRAAQRGDEPTPIPPARAPRSPAVSAAGAASRSRRTRVRSGTRMPPVGCGRAM